ncbi:GTP pyrophosphokinase [Corynebacterium pseudodiphtheriticum]|uniref:GTP pyrophosphokinase n=1 Tax=Corynebacterium pseudodiphtheriticum TaxID=37637 RepID=UPI0025430997|nr:GTP pyrophosphokinase [Corynebacterium pseudodiphtheriticum]MDK4244127.1 GTP pyrophosphokinase [Corynebacterium pseudodiphtheriticum]
MLEFSYRKLLDFFDELRLCGGGMNSSRKSANFLGENPPFSKSRVNKQGSLWRDGQDFEVKVINEYIAFNAVYVEELLSITEQITSGFMMNISPAGDAVTPDSGSYLLSARVKTKDTLLEKLQRLQTTPLMNIQDVAGIRFDCDLSLTEQTEVAEVFKRGFENSGAKRVDIRDCRDEPHSGYRAIHLHIRGNAGRSEMQIRTAWQSKWANYYEEAADIFGREIRYLHEGATMPPKAQGVVMQLLEASTEIAEFEQRTDSDSHYSRDHVRNFRRQIDDKLSRIQAELRQQRI